MIEETQTKSRGEKTKSQTIGAVSAFLAQLEGFAPGSKGTYATYRKMRSNPTVALARAVATAPIRTATWSVQAEDGVPEEAIELVKAQMKTHWYELIRNILYALDYGWSPFEKVWGINPEGQLVYMKLKPLIVDRSSILLDPQNGKYKGLKNINIILDSSDTYIYTHDSEAGNMYGRSRHENIRLTAWTQWDQVMEKFGKYTTKISGIIPMVEYPPGVSTNEDGVEKDNFELATAILQNLGSGAGVTMPNTLAKWAEDMVLKGIDIGKLKAWQIEFLETKGSHGTQFNVSLRHFESLMMRGWLVPERTATEGQYGTKAESEVQGVVALTIADLVYLDILRSINWHVVNPIVTLNYGLEYENKIWLERSDPNPVLRKLLSDIFAKVLTEGANIEMLTQWVDVNAALDALSIPKAEDTIVIPEKKKEPELPITENAKKIYEKLNSFVNP